MTDDCYTICEVQVRAIIKGRAYELPHADADIFFDELSKTLKILVT
jgi:hypothetical protein